MSAFQFQGSMAGMEPVCDPACVPSKPGDPMSGRCVVTGDGFCGHPNMCSLQPHHKRDPAVMQRWLSAKRFLVREAAGERANRSVE
jgi:hypothetical protein